MSKKERKIAIFYEHPDWFQPLFAELDRRRIAFDRIDAANHGFDPHESESYEIFFNRMSASAYLRGHENAIFYTRNLLHHLALKRVRVVNGEISFALETSKAMQLSLLDSLCVGHPRTVVVNSSERALRAVEQIGFPSVIKPNIGGRGAGIVRFDRIAEVRDALETGAINVGPDGTSLVQEYVPKRGGCIQRVETLGGKFLYGLKIYASDENFNLCPAEVCRTDNVPPSGEVCPTNGLANGLRIEKFDPPASVIKTVERVVRVAEIDVGGVEYLIDDRTGEPLFYDINALSNFVTGANELIGFDPHEKLVDFLEKELSLCDTDTGYRSSAAG